MAIDRDDSEEVTSYHLYGEYDVTLSDGSNFDVEFSYHDIAKSIDGDAEAIAKDQLGFTNPNLHRRVNPHEPSDVEPSVVDPLDQELTERKYKLQISGFDSYRSIEIITHDENSTKCEIP